MSKIRRLAGETVLYGLGSIVPRFLNFLLIRIHTDVLNPAQYGIITDTLAVVAFLNVIYSFGMETAYFRFASKPGADERHIFNLAQTVVIGISVFVSLGLIVFAGPMSGELGFGRAHVSYVYWVVAIMLLDAVVMIPFARLRLQKKALQFAAGKFINILILVGLNIYFLRVVYNPEIGFAYVFLANLLANLFFLPFFARTLLSWRPAFDRVVSREMFRYAYPVMLTGLAGMTNETFSRKTLKYWLPEGFYPGRSNEYVLGIFGAVYKFAVLMNLAVQAFRYAAEPFFFSNAADKNSPELFARINHYFIVVCCVILLGVGINLDLLKIFFLPNPLYWEGLSVVPILLLGYLFLGVYYNFTVWFKLTDRTYFGTILTAGGAVITIAANYVLIPVAGYMGSSWATLLCYFSMTAACYWFGQKYYPIPYAVGKGLAYIVITTGLVYVVNGIPVESLWLASAFHGLVMLSYLLILYFVERRGLRGVRR